jgi:hypothetical protein
MTFDDWWKKNKEMWELPRARPFSGIAEALAFCAWSEGLYEGCRQASERFRTPKPDTDKEG